MRKVIRLDETERNKPIVLTHFIQPNTGEFEPDHWDNYDGYDKIVYLGKDPLDNNIFACYNNNGVTICKGHLNDGVY